MLHERDNDGHGPLDKRLRAQQDANYNITDLMDTTGQVVERYAYGPFGAVKVHGNDQANGDGPIVSRSERKPAPPGPLRR